MIEEPKFDTCQIDALAAAETGETLILKPSAELINVEQPVDLKELFHELETLTWSLADECREIDEIILMMQEKRAVKEEEYAPRMKDLQERIKAEIRRED